MLRKIKKNFFYIIIRLRNTQQKGTVRKMKKRALISVFDKTGIVEFAKELSKLNFEIVSTGGTYNLLKENDINVINTNTLTGFTDLLNGKVKTLHPKIHAGILADIENDLELQELTQENIEPFSLVVVNLYPFENVANEGASLDELIENIDIGGVTMLRGAAKNNKNVGVLCEAADYTEVLVALKQNEGILPENLKQTLALKAFATTAKYDSLIGQTLGKIFGAEFSKNFIFEKINDLRYGENPHQSAAIYKTEKMADYEFLHGKELSYNNIVDMTAAVGVAAEFYDVPAVAIIKHATPCGVALGKDIHDAYLKALDCDPISAFGGIIAFTKTVTLDVAKHVSSMFLEVIIAPDFEQDAFDLLSKKKNIRLIKLNTPLKTFNRLVKEEIKITPFGALVQNTDTKELDKDTFNVVTKEKPTAEIIEDMIFAFKVAKHVKSNAIVVAKDFKTLGICGGQTSRVDAVEIALTRACDGAKNAVLASDGFFPAIDNIEVAAQCRIAAIIQPGGSIKDDNVIAACDKFGISMVTTGIRHFKH